jgi:hypothetical protein
MKLLLSLVLLSFLILILYILHKKLTKENYKVNRYAICFLAVKPTIELYNFITNLQEQDIEKSYDFYLCIDQSISNEELEKFNKINIIYIPNGIAEEKGFKGSVLYFPERACSRDKALYYFSIKNKKHEQIWFIEEDVFFYNLQTIKYMDNEYDNSVDLISKGNVIKNKKNPLDWWWPKIINKVSLPWARSMICIIRISKKLLNEIEKYASLNKSLFLDEALFNTIALQNNLVVKCPIELSTIYENEWAKRVYYNWDEKWMNEQTLNPYYFLHPVKDFNQQNEYRKQISKLNK